MLVLVPLSQVETSGQSLILTRVQIYSILSYHVRVFVTSQMTVLPIAVYVVRSHFILSAFSSPLL